jgi:RNA polymerase sigma factor (sigma-70 family)
MESKRDVKALMDGLGVGDEECQREFAGRYLPLLERWGQKRLPPGYRIAVDDEDLAVSVIRTVLRRAPAGFEMPGNEEEAKAYLMTIFLRKMSHRLRHAFRKKRDVRRTVRASELERVDGRPFDVEDPQEHQLDALWEDMLGVLTDRERLVVRMVCDGASQDEIKKAIGVTTWARVCQILRKIEDRLEKETDHGDRD